MMCIAEAVADKPFIKNTSELTYAKTAKRNSTIKALHMVKNRWCTGFKEKTHQSSRSRWRGEYKMEFPSLLPSPPLAPAASPPHHSPWPFPTGLPASSLPWLRPGSRARSHALTLIPDITARLHPLPALPALRATEAGRTPRPQRAQPGGRGCRCRGCRRPSGLRGERELLPPSARTPAPRRRTPHRQAPPSPRQPAAHWLLEHALAVGPTRKQHVPGGKEVEKGRRVSQSQMSARPPAPPPRPYKASEGGCVANSAPSCRCEGTGLSLERGAGPGPLDSPAAPSPAWLRTGRAKQRTHPLQGPASTAEPFPHPRPHYSLIQLQEHLCW